MKDENDNNSHNDELCLKLCSTIADGMYNNAQLLGNDIIDISKMSKKDIKKMVDNCSRKVIYNKKYMWFDYQALFDKTRNKLLGKTDNIEVNYVDFEENPIAKEAIFNSDEIDTSLLKNVLNGDLDSIEKIDPIIFQYYWCKKDELSDKDQEIVYINHLYFLTIKIALCEYDEHTYYHYLEHVNSDFLPTYFSSDSLRSKNNKPIEKMNFYAIARPIMGSIFFDRNFY